MAGHDSVTEGGQHCRQHNCKQLGIRRPRVCLSKGSEQVLLWAGGQRTKETIRVSWRGPQS